MQTTIKSGVAVLLFMTISVLSSAQSNRFSIVLNSLTSNFNYGIANSALVPSKKNYKGFQVGFAYQAGITPMFSVVPELYFAIKGGALKKNNPLYNSKTTLRINSLEMPVLARLHFEKLYFNAGPYGGYNMGGRLKIEGTNTTPATTWKVSFSDSSDDLKRWDVGFQAGAGYNFIVKQSILTLDIRYGHGLVNISRDIERYNRMLNISVQVSIPGKKTGKEKKG